MENPKKMYLVWMDGVDEQYYNQYFTLEDAVSGHSDGVEVFIADIKFLGNFERSFKIVKSKTKKSKKVA